MNARRFVLLDRDGTIIHEKHYLSNPDEVVLLPGAAIGLRRMLELGLGLVVVTNQSAIGRGYFPVDRLQAIHQRMLELLAAERVVLDDIYYCPHIPEDHCDCRKPEPALAHRAAAEHGFRLHDCFVIGDKRCDTELGRAIGATSLLVRTGYGAETEKKQLTVADYIVDDLADAARTIERLHWTGLPGPHPYDPSQFAHRDHCEAAD